MKTIAFKPLRKIKKTGKITVAGYMQWRKVMSSDNSDFNIVLGGEHLFYNENERVYNHKGELLFWFNHNKPEDLPLNYPDPKLIEWLRNDEEFDGEEWKLKKLNEPLGKGFHHSIQGFDCDGVPVFSHYTQDYIATHYNDTSQFEILTVGMVIKWYGWFLYKLKNSTHK